MKIFTYLYTMLALAGCTMEGEQPVLPVCHVEPGLWEITRTFISDAECLPTEPTSYIRTDDTSINDGLDNFNREVPDCTKSSMRGEEPLCEAVLEVRCADGGFVSFRDRRLTPTLVMRRANFGGCIIETRAEKVAD